MRKISQVFDKWAILGRDKLMEKEHSKTVLKFFKTIQFEKPFTFLDVGCGNGWVVREISKMANCKKAIGIDISKKMIEVAQSKKASSKEVFFQSKIETWRYKGKFDYIFSMESLYYADSMEKALEKIYRLLKPNGKFFCGTDYYKENKSTTNWQKLMKVKMDLRSSTEWKNMFKEIGFKTKVKQVKDEKNTRKWKREFGTLFIIGSK